MREELQVNKERLLRLESFALSEEYRALPAVKRSLLSRQLHHMREYLSLLSRRIFMDVYESKPSPAPPTLGGESRVTSDEDCMPAETRRVKDIAFYTVMPPAACDKCSIEAGVCKKVDIRGIGEVCLVPTKEPWHKWSDKKPRSGTFLVHQRWPNGHRFVFVAHYDADTDVWRPWEDIDVDGLPLDDVQREMITHWRVLTVPVE